MVSREGLSPGEYSGEVTVRYAGETLIIPVVMNIMSSAAATVSIESINEVGANSAKVKASIISVGSSSVTKMGICWSSEHNKPSISDKISNQGSATAPCSFTALLTDLTPETTYYCRAYAQNAAGVSYSDECLSFTTTSTESGGGSGGEQGSVTQGLMLYLTFDDGVVKDESINEVETIPIGGELTFLADTPNGTGKSLFLNGIKGQYISIPYALFDGLNNYSISFWAKDFGMGSFVSALNVNGKQYASYNRPKVFIDSNSKIIFDTFGRAVEGYSTGTPFSYPLTNIQSGQWHHICVTLDIPSYRNANKCLYIDGAYVDTMVGGDAEGGYSVSMTTKIDNIRFYNRTLSKEEVKTIFQSEK